MSINNYIQKHFGEIKRKITAVTRNHANTDDLISDCVLALLQKGPDYLQKLLNDGKVQHYLIKMAYIQYNSSTSPFHRKYRQGYKLTELKDKHELIKEEPVEEVDIDNMANDIKLYIGNLPYYERELATQHFIQGKSQRKLSKTYNINRLHISKDIKLIRTNLKLSFNKDKYKKDE